MCFYIKNLKSLIKQMRVILYICLLLVLFSCNNTSIKVNTFTNVELEDLFAFPLSTIESDSISVYETYDNKRFLQLLSTLYRNRSDLGYVINQSILDEINNRTDCQVPREIVDFKYWNLNFVSDSTIQYNNIIVFSEPLFINKSLVNITWAVKNNKSDTTKNYSLFLRKDNTGFSIIEFYDAQLDMFYEPT